MVKQVSLLLILLLPAPAPPTRSEAGRRAPDARLIGSVRRTADDCGCYFRAAGQEAGSERYLFFEEAGEGASLMTIGGRDVRLRLVTSKEPSGGARRKRERLSRRYASWRRKDSHVFRSDRRVRRPPYDPECRANGYAETITASEGALSRLSGLVLPEQSPQILVRHLPQAPPQHV